MDKFVARANIDRFLDLLERAGGSRDASALNTLLANEFRALGIDPEQIEFAESRVARYRHHVARLARGHDGLEQQPADRAQAGDVLVDFDATLKLLEDVCLQMRRHLNDARP